MTPQEHSEQPLVPTGQDVLADDLLVGVEAIAQHLGFTKKQAYAHVERGNLPCFKIGTLVCMRRSTLLEWIERQELESRLRANGASPRECAVSGGSMASIASSQPSTPNETASSVQDARRIEPPVLQSVRRRLRVR